MLNFGQRWWDEDRDSSVTLRWNQICNPETNVKITITFNRAFECEYWFSVMELYTNVPNSFE